MFDGVWHGVAWGGLPECHAIQIGEARHEGMEIVTSGRVDDEAMVIERGRAEGD